MFVLTATGFVAVASAGAVAGAEDDGEVETTTVLDFTNVVVQPPEVVVLPEAAGAATVFEEGVAEAAALDGAVAAGALVDAPAVDETFEPGAEGDGGGACLAAVIVVSRGTATVVSRPTVTPFDALRTLSVGRAGEADRAVAKRTCSIIADQAAGGR